MRNLLEIYKRQAFRPNLLSVFINPFYFIRKSLFREIKRFAPELDGKLLDFGCGSKPYRELFINAPEYIGVDIENEGHSHENEDVDLYYDGKTLPFEDNYFDSVFCSEVLEHVFNIDQIISEIRRVLKPHGKVLITIPFIWDEHETPNDFGRYTSFGTKNLFERHGFNVLNYEKTSHFIEVVFQLLMLYVHHLLFTKNKYLNILINLIFVFPITFIGLIVSFISPKIKSLYFNNSILISKIEQYANEN